MTTAEPPRARGARALVRHHPTVSFFVIAYGLSWLAWLPYVLSQDGTGVLGFSFPAWLGSTQIAGMLLGAYLGPLTAAFTVTALAEGRVGLRAWRGRLTHWRVGWRWYLAVGLGVPASIVVASLALPGAWTAVALPSLALLAIYLPVLVLQFFTSAAAEEPGWRDFALPRLQRRFGALPGTVVLGLLWGGWHLPLFLTDWGGYPEIGWDYPVEFVLGCVPISIVMTWVFNRTGQGLPLLMIFHASINTTFSSVWSAVFPGMDLQRDPLHATVLAATIVAVLVIVKTRGRLGLDEVGTTTHRGVRSDHRIAGKHVHG